MNKLVENRKSDEKKSTQEDIAIIGVGLRVSSAETLSDYWEIINNKISCTEPYPKSRRDLVSNFADLFYKEDREPEYYPGSYLHKLDQFDNSFFHISPKEASLMDPVQRIFLQTIVNTFEDAGYTNDMLKNTKTGVFVGYTSSSFKDNYIVDIAFNHPELLQYSMVGNMAPLIPSRVSQLLDLHGPTMVIDTACSSSLVAVHEACESIKNGTCEMAVAGGIKFHLLPIILDTLKLGIEADDGKTRTFDKDAAGTSIGEGCITVLLKSLREAERDDDTIYAVIKGSAINHDGTASGITAPNPAAQANVILEAWKNSGINPESIGYIEAHGTATALGDPIEIQGIIKAFQGFTDRKQFCAIGASKSNIGHLHECAGLAALLKLVAALKHHVLPPTMNFLSPNPNIDFINSPVYINTISKPWEKTASGIRTGGVSAFGLSGTNCHMVLQEYQKKEKSNEKADMPVVLCISAESDFSIMEYAKKYLEYIEENYDSLNYIQFCYHVNAYKNVYNKRFAIIIRSKSDLREKLKACIKNGQSCVAAADIYYGEIKNSNSDMKARREFKCLVQSNSELMDEILQSDTEDTKQLRRVCEAFINGGSADWRAIDRYQHYGKLNLPTYPYQPISLWLPVAKKQQNKKVMYYKKIWKEEPARISGSRLEHLIIIKLDEEEHSYHNFILENSINKTEIVINKKEKIEEYSERLKNALKTVTHIVMEVGSRRDKTFASVVNNQERTVDTLLTLAKYLSENDKAVKLAVITKNAFEVTQEEEYLDPENAAIYGFGKCISRENKKVSYLSMDIDQDTSEKEILLELVSDSKEEIVAYRNGKRYVEGFTELALNPSDNNGLNPGGVYLVTGGLGGIGYEVSKELCKRAEEAVLVLINRSQLPFDKEGEEQEEEIAEKLLRYHTLESMAKKVEYYSCDVSDYQGMQGIIKEVKDKYGHINGIIHGAGVGGGMNIEELTYEHFMGMVRPKIYGAWILDELTKDEPLDFFVMFSSIATVFSSTKLSDYTYANTYLDALCNYRKKYRKGKTITINWSTWSEIGMSVKHKFTIDTLFKTVKSAEGVTGFFDVLGSNERNVVIGEMNLDNNIALLLHTYPVLYSEYILNKLKSLKASNADKAAATQTGELRLTGGAYGEIEKKIAGACREVLGYDEININDNFFELGADSILLNRIYTLLASQFEGELEVTDLFAYPSVKQLSEFLSSKTSVVSEREKESRERVSRSVSTKDTNNDVAIIGIGLDFPCADNLEEYWSMLVNGINAVRTIPYERGKDIKNHLCYLGMAKDEIKFSKCAYLDAINQFDYSLFGMSPREARLIDPINRLFLQCAWGAIEDSGYGGDKLRGSNTGVFLGYTANLGNLYSRLLYEIDPQLFGESLPINQVSMAASRIAYVNDLKGPSMVIDTACSSSLIAIHMACQQIRSGNCELALAGGASLTLSPIAGGFTVGFESAEEKTRSFAEGSTGTAVGEGIGVVLLKPLESAIRDNDSIYGVIKGSASNQDGSSFGIAAPNYMAQSEAIRKAWLDADIEPESISYIEAHGTGTQLGDPIEIKGITHAFREYTDKKQFCALGTVKPNIGHLNEASGISGVIKIILMMQHREITPCMFFQTPNANIDFINSPIYPVTQRRKWESHGFPLRAGINGLGMSGTNCHLIIEEKPVREEAITEESKVNIFTLSCQYWEQLQQLIDDMIVWLKKNHSESISAICNTVNTGRKHHNFRLAVIIKDVDELIEKLERLRFPEYRLINEDDIYVGRFSVVSEDKTVRAKHELTAEEQKKLTAKADVILDRLSEGKTLERITELLSMYVQGAQIKWQRLYAWEERKLHMPHYPFRKEYCWIDEPVQLSELDHLGLDGIYYQVVWNKEPLEEKNISTDNQGTYLIFFDAGKRFAALTDILSRLHIRVIEVMPGEEYQKINENSYIINNQQEAMESLFTSLSNVEINKILHFAAMSDQKLTSYCDIQRSLDYGFYHIINLIKGMAAAHFNKELELITVACNAYSISGSEEQLNPESAIVLSLGKVIEQEYTNIECRALDIDQQVTEQELIQEIFLEDRQMYMIGYRNGERYTEWMKEAEVIPEKELIREDGTYLITGGLGDIGLEVAKYLSEKGCKNIILLGRSGFYPEEEWDNPDFSDYIKNKIQLLREIKAGIRNLQIYQADVSDNNSIKNAIADIHKKYGRINGVIHSAGVAGAGFILRKERENFQSVLDPKILGTWNLDELTREDSLDFMLLFSSAVTMSGEAGQSDYVAANTFLDTFTDYRNARGERTYAINWVSWKETGMSVRYGINIDSITKALPTAQAIGAMDKLLMSNCTRAIIGQYTISPNLITVTKYSRNRVDSHIMDAINRLQKIYNLRENSSAVLLEGGREVAQVKKGKLLYIPHSEKDTGNVNSLKINIFCKTNSIEEIQENLIQIYSSILGYSEIDIYDNFFEMGGDSIMLTRMQAKIDEVYPSIINVAKLFEYTSVFALANHIREEIEKNQAKKNDEKKEEAAQEVAAASIESRISPFDPYLNCEYHGELSAAQKRMFIMQKLSRDKLLYNNPFAFRFKRLKDIDVENKQLIEESLAKLAKRHEILRTCFFFDKNVVKQKICEDIKIEVQYVEKETFEDINFEELLTEFDLFHLPLFKVTIIILPKDEYVLLFDIHHIISDGTSSRIINKEFQQLLKGEELLEITYQYRHYIQYEKELLSGSSYEQMKNYWLDRIQGLSVDEYLLPNVSKKEKAGHPATIILKTDIHLHKVRNASEFSLLLSAFYILMYQYSNKQDITIGVPVLGRTEREVMTMPGMFINMLPMRSRINGEQRLSDFIQTVCVNIMNDLQMQLFPYDEMVKLYRNMTKVKTSDLFRILFEYEGSSLDLFEDKNKEDDFIIPVRSVKYPMNLLVCYKNKDMYIKVDYDSDVYEDAFVKELIQNYIHLLEVINNDSDDTIAAIVKQ